MKVQTGDVVYIKRHHPLRFWDINGVIREHQGQTGRVLYVACLANDWPILVEFANGCRHVYAEHDVQRVDSRAEAERLVGRRMGR